MTSAPGLQQALDRLRVPHPAVAAAAVAAVFELLARTPGLSAAQRDAAIAQCLSSEHLAAVEAAVQALLLLDAASLPKPAERQDLLLTALAVASPATAPPLAAGMLRPLEQLSSGSPETAPLGAYRSHLLSKALLSNVAATQPLLLGIARLLSRAATAPDASPAPLHCLLTTLRPFLSFALLDPAVAQAQPLLPLQLHGALARVAACSPSLPAQLELLRLLVAHLPALRLSATSGSAQRQAAAAGAVGEVMDVLESCAEEPDAATVSQLAGHLVCLCYDAVAAAAPSLLQQLLAALSQLAAHWPQLLLQHAANLGMLLVQPPGVPLGAAEAKAVLALLGQVLADKTATAGQHGQLPALLLLPLLQQAAFSSSRDVKQWAGHVLALLGQLGGCSGDSSADIPLLHGAAGAAQAAQELLGSLWRQPLQARHWLASLHLELTTPSSDDYRGNRLARDLQQLSGGTLLVLCALLQHPEEPVQRAALRGAVAALEATPLLGLSLLLLLVHQLQRQVELFLSGKRQRPSRLLLDLLWALPAAGRHPAALPFVLRTLQPLLGAGAPEVLQAAGLRLLCRLWHTSGGRAYPQLRAAVIGYAAPGQEPGLALRVARAECLRDICSSDPDKAAELVGMLQECLSDEAPTVQAIGLDCIALLCEADVLEFYTAWRVVHRSLPRLPEHAGTAAAWVRLLGSGGLDAAVQPVTAAAIVDALWLAAAHEAPEVRCQAYASLAAYDMETLETMEALRPLCSYAALLHHELELQQRQGLPVRRRRQRQVAAQAVAECQALVQAALAYEHATRRRTAAASKRGAAATGAGRERGSTAASGAGAALSHRLQSVLPKQLLGGSATAADLLQRLPEVPAAAVLYFRAPPPPPPSGSTAAAAAAARHAAVDYQAVFLELIRQPPAVPNASEDAQAASEALAAWAAFLRRWLAAVRAAAKEQATGPQQAATDAAMAVWAAVQPQLDSSSGPPAATANAIWAAAALSGCTPQPLLPLVTAVHGALQNVAAGGPAHSAAAQRAALAAMGAMAEAARVTLGTPVLDQTLHLMRQRLGQGQQEAAAALTGLGLACSSLASSAVPATGAAVAAPSNLPAAAEQVLRGGLTSLLGALAGTWPEAAKSISTAAAAAGLSPLATQMAQQADELLPSAAAALAAALPAATVVVPGLARLLWEPAISHLPQTSSLPAAAALCSLLQSATAAGFRAGTVSDSDVGGALALLLTMVNSGSQAGTPPDGRLMGAAAAAAGALLAEALQQGFTPAAEEHSVPAVLQLLLSAPEAAARLPSAAPAKWGVAAALAAVLVSGAVEPGSAQFKAAVATLEGLALKDSDPRVRRACALPLAKLCFSVKRNGGVGSSSPAPSGAAADSSRGLAQLPLEGALRPLLESLMEGHWARSPEDSEEHQLPLAAPDAAAILHCLAAAERLPPMNYGALCRRLLRTFDGEAAVADAVVAFVAAQGSRQQQQYQLADMAAELLGPPGPGCASSATVLAHLPQLLAALPEAQAVGLLQDVCQCVSGGAAAGSRQQSASLLQLLGSMQQLLVASGSSAISPALQQAAQQALAEMLLPALPPPGRYPLPLAAMAPAAAMADGAADQHQLLSLQQRCWVAALRCLARLPLPQLESLMQQPELLHSLPLHAAYAAATLVAAGTMHARALQHPRNLLLSAGALPPQRQALVASCVGRAVAALPAEKQQQWLLEALDASKTSANPEGALQLAASIAACSAAASLHTIQLAADHILCTGSDAVAALPFTLPLLLEDTAWQRSTALLLQRLAAAPKGVCSSRPEHEAEWRQRCLLAARHHLPPDVWPLLASLL